MSRLFLIFIVTGFLSGCGADGEPEQPTMNVVVPV
jgi:hypothetical protein